MALNATVSFRFQSNSQQPFYMSCYGEFQTHVKCCRRWLLKLSEIDNQHDESD